MTGLTQEPDQRPSGDQGPQPPQGVRGGLVIARPFGIPVLVSPYWFLIAGLFVLFYASNLDASIRPEAVRYLIAALFVVLLYASVLIHELSHCVVARAYRLPVRRILLYPLGGFSEIEQEPPTPAQEFLVSAAGPAISLALAAAGYGVFVAVPGGLPRVLVGQLVLANVLVGIFNLLPGLPLDGGRILRAGLWRITRRPATATVWSAWAGRALAVALVVFPTILFERGSSLVNSTYVLWLVIIAIFMWVSAGQAIRAAKVRERLPGLQARRLARKAIAVPAGLPLSEAIRRADEAQARALVVVDHESAPVAIVNETAVMATPEQRRPWIEVGSLARAIDPGIVLAADLSGMALLEAVRRSPATEYLLIEPSGQVFGVLAASDLDHAFAGV
ncbi:MAG TPA: site-2 protease family protein [Streptosporangiaceae bacterium]